MLQTQRCDPQPQGKTYFYSADPVVQHQRHHILFSDAPLSHQPLIWRRSETLEDLGAGSPSAEDPQASEGPAAVGTVGGGGRWRELGVG